jgi:hypothetical protein
MTIADFESETGGNRLTAILRRVSGPIESARKRAAELASRVPGAARKGAATVVARAPEAAHTARVGAHATTGALQHLPDSTLRSLAASSIGLGAGLYLAGKRRLAVVAGVGPALVVSAAIALRPTTPVKPGESTS